MKKVALIGAGRLGTTLGYSLLKRGFKIISVSCKSLSSAKKSAEVIGEGIPMTDNKKALEKAEIIILSVPDDQMKNLVKELSPLDLHEKFIFHCSGILSSHILKPLQISGAVTASIHPIQSFSKRTREPHLFKNTYFSIEGDEKALKLSKMIVKKLGGQSLILEPNDKPLYHTACTMASNYLVVLMELACQLLAKTGVKKELQNKILLPLIKGTLGNIEKNSIPSSLTGPVSRGDTDTLKSHLDSLKGHPSILIIYKNLAQQALEIAKKENRLSQNKIREVKALLE